MTRRSTGLVSYWRAAFLTDFFTFTHTVKKPCRNAPNSDVDNGGAEPNDVGVGISDPHVVSFAPPLSTSEFRAAFFYSAMKTIGNTFGSMPFGSPL
jgi:hypothetical protein